MAISNPLIVVIDDDTAVRNSLEFSLGIEGFAVHTYESAEDVLQTAELSDCRCLDCRSEHVRHDRTRADFVVAQAGRRNSRGSDQWARDADADNAGSRLRRPRR